MRLNSIRKILVVAIFMSVSLVSFSQRKWQEILTVKDLYESYPEKLESLLNQINLDYQGLKEVKKAKKEGDIISACKSLLAYYRDGKTASYLRRDQPKKSNDRRAYADTILNNVFTVQNVKGKVPIGSDGHRDWYYKGPNEDKEWAWLSNRHSQIRSLLTTYFETGNTDYVEYINLFLRDFIIKSAPYPGINSNTSVWRGLEVAARAKVWSSVFYSLLNCKFLDPSTQLLILSSLPDHAHYSRNFHKENNWLTMEISSLATVATNFPEFKNSEVWLDYSIETMVESMRSQVYADGVQTELSSDYHYVSLANFKLFKSICDRANKKLPKFFNQTIKDMYDYLARTMRPNGFRILNNDGDYGSDRNRVLRVPKKLENEEWKYIVSNGQRGVKPINGPSYAYPWAGQIISRSGYDKNAHWSFFDIGPWGSGHQHDDKLHISIHAYGRDLLVDSGRFAYTGEVAEKFRSYAKSSASHNVILVDGKGQNSGPKLAEKPLDESQFKITDSFDYATNSFNDFEEVNGAFTHTRALFYVRGEFWVVVDRISTDRPRTVEALWHWHPDNNVERKRRLVKTNNAKGNLAVIPVGKQSFDIDFIKGKETPEPQGWYSSEYNKYEPNVVSAYKTMVNETSTLVWILYPSNSKLPRIKSKIISENQDEIVVKVKSKKGKRQLRIPFFDSTNAELIRE